MMFAPAHIRREIYFIREDDEEARKIADTHGDAYIRFSPIETECEGEQAAEEAFDLTNNPSRQAERVVKYGRGQSLTVGDMVEVTSGDSVNRFMCMSFGWKKLD